MSLAARNGTKPAVPAPPEDIRAEQATLGAMMIEGAAVDRAAGLLGCADFSRLEHRQLFEILVGLRQRGEPADAVTLRAELDRRELLDAVGGQAYLMALLDAVPTAANVEHYAKIVAGRATLRRVWELGHRVVADAQMADTDPAALLQSIQGSVERIGEGRTLGPVVSRRRPIAEKVVDLADVESPQDLPLLFGPYLLRGAAHWMTGQTGIGKSTLLYNVCCSLAEGTPLWGIECEPARILYIDMESGDWGRGKKVERLYRDAPRVRDRLLFVREPIRLPEELTELIAFVRERAIDLVVFDTARRCFRVDDENSNAEVYNRVVPTLDALKAVGVASLTLGHPPKNGAFGARGAGAQEDAGDVNLTLTMHRGEVSDADGVLALRVTKNRLLGLGIPPLFLKRVGQDRFEPLAGAEALPAEANSETPSARVRCAQDVLEALAVSGGPVRFTEIVKELVRRGHAEGTAKKAITLLQKEGQIAHDLSGGYVLTGAENGG